MGRKGKEISESLIHTKELVDRSKVHRKPPKGYVPVLVGRGERAERVLVNVKLFKDPCMSVLLEMAEEDLGDKEGILRIPCDSDYFRKRSSTQFLRVHR